VKGKDLTDYLQDGYFTHDSIFRTEVALPDYGVAGDPVPYTLRGDNMLTIILLVCFVMFMVSVSHMGHFILRQTKNFFYLPATDKDTFDETSGELRFQLFLTMLCSLLLALLAYLYTTKTITHTFRLDNDLQIIIVFFVAMLLYFSLKGILYTMVNNVFFSSKVNLHWIKNLLFIVSIESVLLFPIVILQIYFQFSIQNATIMTVLVLFFVKMLTFYKCWSIFFRANGGLLQTFLYFCTLEIAPLLTFVGGLRLLIEGLRI